MARRRFFVDEVRNGQAEIEGDDAHHLTRVLRVEAGQMFEITDNSRVWLAEVDVARKNLVRFAVVHEIDRGPELPDTVLYMALIKFERFEWAVEKATELGVTRIVPVEASRSERGLEGGAKKRVERWRKLAREASEQSRRLRAPDVSDAIRFRDLVSVGSGVRVWLDEQAGAPPLADVLSAAGKEEIGLAIGPEGGWADPEREQFAAAGWKGSSLGPLVLRAETAACAALAVVVQARIQSNQGDAG